MADARRVAVDALQRIEQGSYANLLMPSVLARSGLTAQDRRFVTDLVYGTTRMRRACDWLVDRYMMRAPDDRTRIVLRLGAYQLAFLGVAAHAAVSATVEVAPNRTRGLVNAVLRKVAAAPAPAWPSPGVELSYPDWIITRLDSDLGPASVDALRAMNEAPAVTTRADGYVQDLASQWVFAHVGATAGERVLDLCAAPGGKATGMAQSGAMVVANDARPGRARLIPGAVGSVAVTAADGTAPPFPPGTFDRVLVDAPCSGLGVLRRRPDARWRISEDDVAVLAALQQALLTSAAALVRPGGVVLYSVCTMTAAETTGVDEFLAGHHPELVAVPPPGDPWRPHGRGGLLLPQAAGTDGMFSLKLTRS